MPLPFLHYHIIVVTSLQVPLKASKSQWTLHDIDLNYLLLGTIGISINCVGINCLHAAYVSEMLWNKLTAIFIHWTQHAGKVGIILKPPHLQVTSSVFNLCRKMRLWGLRGSQPAVWRYLASLALPLLTGCCPNLIMKMQVWGFTFPLSMCKTRWLNLRTFGVTLSCTSVLSVFRLSASPHS